MDAKQRIYFYSLIACHVCALSTLDQPQASFLNCLWLDLVSH